VRGPYTPWSGNPILTQRHLDRNRADPITSTGHADFVTTAAGETWAIFLGTRPYANDTYNTGRETFLMRVNWRDGWPVLTSGQEGVPYVALKPKLPAQPAPKIATHGNFTVRDDFSSKTLALYWLQLRTPRETAVDLSTTPGWLSLAARPVSLSSRGQPSFVGRRQQHRNATATTAMRFTPERDGDRAGLVAFQSENNWYWLAVGRDDGKPSGARVQRRAIARLCEPARRFPGQRRYHRQPVRALRRHLRGRCRDHLACPQAKARRRRKRRPLGESIMTVLVAIILLGLALLGAIVWSARPSRLHLVREAADNLPFAL